MRATCVGQRHWTCLCSCSWCVRCVRKAVSFRLLSQQDPEQLAILPRDILCRFIFSFSFSGSTQYRWAASRYSCGPNNGGQFSNHRWRENRYVFSSSHGHSIFDRCHATVWMADNISILIYPGRWRQRAQFTDRHTEKLGVWADIAVYIDNTWIEWFVQSGRFAQVPAQRFRYRSQTFSFVGTRKCGNALSPDLPRQAPANDGQSILRFIWDHAAS